MRTQKFGIEIEMTGITREQAAQVIAGLDRDLLRKKRALLLRAQESGVRWKRPFQEGDDLRWLSSSPR